MRPGETEKEVETEMRKSGVLLLLPPVMDSCVRLNEKRGEGRREEEKDRVQLARVSRKWWPLVVRGSDPPLSPLSAQAKATSIIASIASISVSFFFFPFFFLSFFFILFHSFSFFFIQPL